MSPSLEEETEKNQDVPSRNFYEAGTDFSDLENKSETLLIEAFEGFLLVSTFVIVLAKYS